ncbi:MAG: hypothetical protein HXX10_00160 [Rhodoplanes sp.]|uniref:hypothetical protein n=1 Tax=Rhodoplanes sp. TaxID=1968906 RepID=UPI00179DAEFB|nr:hypothetical protein [Rhodoplanes sp.]NVO12428.1 hypothetical protein [Rhodoplanes sp.]
MMILGLSFTTFTALHVAISLIGVVSGLVAMSGMLVGKRMASVTLVFLASTALTSLTGLLYPSASFGTRHMVGIASIALLAIACLAAYAYRLAGVWRPVYVASALLALYFNTIAAIVQAFQKIPALAAWAASGSEPRLLTMQVAVFVLFAVMGGLAVWGGRREAVGPYHGERLGGQG